MRAFLAAPVDETTRQAFAALEADLIARLDLSANPRVRVTWVRPEVVHLTFKFLGEIDGVVARQLDTAVGGAVRHTGRVELPLDRLGVFPRADAPRALWIGPAASWRDSEEAARLMALRHAIDVACGAAGFTRDEGPWRPHLTLARVRSGEHEVGRTLRSTGALDQTLAVPPMRIEQLVLMKSDLLPGGPMHTPIWARPLS